MAYLCQQNSLLHITVTVAPVIAGGDVAKPTRLRVTVVLTPPTKPALVKPDTARSPHNVSVTNWLMVLTRREITHEF